MTSPDQPADAVRGRAAADPESLRQLADQLHRSITQAFEDWTVDSNATRTGAQRETEAFARPVAVPPVRMEQLARTPEPTADLDDLVDLLVPRLVEQLVPALRAALRDDA